jgi:DNA-binding Lrp family transcriptional regulator
MLLQRKRPISGADLARVAGINPTAMNNRLVELEKLGLATGTWAGRKRLWVSGKQEAAR